MAGDSLQCYPGSMSEPDGQTPENDAAFASPQMSGSPSSLPDSGIIAATLAKPPLSDDASRHTARRLQSNRKRLRLPIILFLLTCLSTLLAGSLNFSPTYLLVEALEQGSLMPIRQVLLRHWQDGLTYTACVLAILLTHEMGHYLVMVRYRIPATYPLFLPFPISPIGTMGAVIAMDGMKANRKEMFDIGLAGPLAGLVVAIPILWIGASQLDADLPQFGVFLLDQPLLAQWAMQLTSPANGDSREVLWQGQLNPYFMAGWVGLIITGLNMIPVSQLDGGHVAYALFGRRAHWLARGFLVLALAWLVYTNERVWILMLGLLLLSGPDHPPTRDDTVELGWLRTSIGCLSLAIPIVCFAPRAIFLSNW